MDFSLKKIVIFVLVGLLVGLLLLGGIGYLIVNTFTAQPQKANENIAVINVSGPIVSGGSSSFLGEVQANANEIMRQINRAKEDDTVKAILLKVNTPGGSSAASDAIYRELKKFKKSGKPIVVSMGDVAASGGYYVSAIADTIYANPATITGSIGVIMQFQNLEELYNKIGVRPVTFKSGPYKDMGSPSRDLTEEEKEILQNMIDRIYEEFVDVVVEGRGMSKEKVKEIANGRIYTGKKAKELGLVDKLGTFYDARDKTAKLAGIEGEPNLIYYNQSSPLKRLLSSVTQLITYTIFEENVKSNLKLNSNTKQELYKKLLIEQQNNYLQDLQLQY